MPSTKNQANELAVTSHVGRDLLASAAAFKNEAVVVWEYVVNSLQYVDSGVSPRILVRVRNKDRQITISDNGRGMSARDLKHFFQMHGENWDRRRGKPGRGKFGTGKSAAFGIANRLEVETAHNGKRNVVVLTRKAIDESNGEEIPVEWIRQDQPTSEPNGTLITIDDVVLRDMRTSLVSDYIERHLQAFRARLPQVAVNDHVCEYREPEIDSEHRFVPSPDQAEQLGNIELTVKVARIPLSEPEQGIFITAGAGNLVAIETCGVQTKDFGNYLFGEIDVPTLETSDSPIAPYDSTRQLQLNPAHPIVGALLGFIGSKLEKVRAELVKRSKEARKTEEARRLAQEADRIADILNSDFQDVQRRLHDIRSASSRGTAKGDRISSVSDQSDPDSWVQGTQQPGTVSIAKGGQGKGGQGRKAPDIRPPATPDDEGTNAVDPAGNEGPKKVRAKGGFRVEYKHVGQEEHRSVYDSANLLILINLDHPVVAAAHENGSVEEPSFRRLSYEIAFSEYAIALGYILSEQDPDMPLDDLLYEVRDSLNRIASSAAPLYKR